MKALRTILFALALFAASLAPAPVPASGFAGSAAVSTADNPGYVSGNWYSPVNTTVILGAAVPANSIRLLPFTISKPITVAQLGARVGTVSAASNFQLAVYGNNAITGRPTGAALCSTANLSAASLAAVSGTVTNVLLPPGTYWMAINQDNSTAAYTTVSGAEAQTAYLIGSTTLANIISTAATTALLVTVTQTFGTWPDLTSASFAESATNTSALVFLKAA